jgi:putative dimethyl sulfoxide reductase chaperone
MNRRTTLTVEGAVDGHWVHDAPPPGVIRPPDRPTNGPRLVKSLTSTAQPERVRDALDPLLQLIAAAYRTPGPALRADLESGAFADACGALAEALDLVAPDLGALEFGAVQERHVALFVTSGDGIVAPPYAGFAVDGELLGPTFQAMGGTFARYGIEVRGDWADLPDHVAAVAEGAGLLLAAGAADGALEVLERYLAPWFGRYAAAVAAADVGGPYGALTPFLDAAIKEVVREAQA